MNIKYLDFAVVLLCGGVVSPETEWRSGARIELAVELALKNNGYLVISSGISGHSKNEYAESEAYAYFKELMRRHPHFPVNRLLIEDYSRDTVGNIYFSTHVLRAVLSEGGKVTWVSNQFHALRIRRILEVVDSQKCWLHMVESVEAVPDEDGLLQTIECEEEKSLSRFEADLKLSKNLEELLFCRHDFYRVNRFLKELKCVL